MLVTIAVIILIFACLALGPEVTNETIEQQMRDLEAHHRATTHGDPQQ